MIFFLVLHRYLLVNSNFLSALPDKSHLERVATFISRLSVYVSVFMGNMKKITLSRIVPDRFLGKQCNVEFKQMVMNSCMRREFHQTRPIFVCRTIYVKCSDSLQVVV